MKFGVFFLLRSPGAQPSREVYQGALDEMAYADELGYDSIWIAEHHFSNYGYCPNPLALAIKAAQVTKRVRLGTAVLVLPLWHPIRLAEEIALADILTEGRLEVGVARGYQKYEFDRLGVDIEDNRQLSDETLDVLLKALTTAGFSHDGQYFQIPETTTYPRPWQQPHPPIWLAAATRETFQNAVRRGFNCFTSSSTRPLEVVRGAWQYFQEARQEFGVTGEVEFAVQQHIQVAPTDREARERMEHSLWHYRQSNLLRFGRQRVERGVAQNDRLEQEPSDNDLFETHTLSGSPETVREKLQHYQEAVGLTQINCFFHLGGLDGATVKSSMRLFAERVMPHFR